jgi:hypothetical protein
MKRHTTLKKFVPFLKENDVIIVSGPGLIKDIFEFDDQRMFYFERLGLALNFSLGLAMATDKRVFVFCEDGELLRNYDAIAQMGASKCNNIFIVALSCSRYQDSGGQPNIYDSLNAPKGSLFNLGLVVYDFSSYFEIKGMLKELDNIIERARGPMIIMIKVLPGIRKLPLPKFSEKKTMRRLERFVQDKSLGTSLYVP